MEQRKWIYSIPSPTSFLRQENAPTKTFFLRSRVSVLNRIIWHFHSVQYYNWHKREIPTLERTILISSITLKSGYLASVRVNLFERHNLSIVSKEIRSTVEESYRGQGGGGEMQSVKKGQTFPIDSTFRRRKTTIFVLKTRFIPFGTTLTVNPQFHAMKVRDKQFSNKYLYVEQLVFRPKTRHK